MTLTQPPKLLDRVRTTLRTQHYSYRTEQAYVDWTKRFILFHDKQHPQLLNTPEIEEFLTHLALEQHVSPSTQNQALAALLFLYRSCPAQLRGIAIREKRWHNRATPVLERKRWTPPGSIFWGTT